MSLLHSCNLGPTHLPYLSDVICGWSPQVVHAAVTVEHGACPAWLSGTLARHACGVYGETGRPTEDDMINTVPHVFDCVEMGQGYSFNDGEVTFTSR